MAYPSLEQYQQAFQLHARLLADPELKSCKVATSSFGMPLAISGGFALTYTLSNGSKKYAVRCFHREAKGLEQRYEAISKKLAVLKSGYFLDFSFQPAGIKVDGQAFPIVKMAWAKGETLGEFLEKNHQNPQALLNLANALDDLAAYLESQSVAHGDLQTGNLMVSDNGKAVQLIDYDGMFVEDIRSLGSSELGHVNFQHVQRKAINPFDPKLDRFSFISLALAIKALRVDSSLWRKTDSELDAIVFRSNDFLDPGSSKAFALLAVNPQLEADAKRFAAICVSPYAQIPSLADYLSGKYFTASDIKLSGVSGPGAAKHGYVGAYPVLSALDFQGCLLRVGDKVEVIGHITNVKESLDKNGNPFIFINFSDWRGHVFKLSIWSDGIAALAERPTRAWVGRWISVVGLMEPRFSSDGGRSSNVSISIATQGQITNLSEGEAHWRLGKVQEASRVGQAQNANQNVDALNRILGKAAARQGAATPSFPTATAQPAGAQKVARTHPMPSGWSRTPLQTPTVPSQPSAQKASLATTTPNQDILNRIKSGNSASGSGPAGRVVFRQSPLSRPPSMPSQSPKPPTAPTRSSPSNRSLISRFFDWLNQ